MTNPQPTTPHPTLHTMEGQRVPQPEPTPQDVIERNEKALDEHLRYGSFEFGRVAEQAAQDAIDMAQLVVELSEDNSIVRNALSLAIAWFDRNPDFDSAQLGDLKKALEHSDWQARALAAEQRVGELEESLRYVWQDALVQHSTWGAPEDALEWRGVPDIDDWFEQALTPTTTPDGQQAGEGAGKLC